MSGLTEEEQITLDSYNKLAKPWSDGHLVYDSWQEDLVEFQKLLPKGSVLEIGCGGGRDAKTLIGAGYDYLGTDISDGLLTEARKNCPNGKFEQVSLYDLDFANSFNGFWCSGVLHHVPRERIAEAMQAIKQSIKLGAVGFIATKEGSGEKMMQDPKYPGDNRLFVYWQDEEFRDLLASQGFEVLKFTYRPLSETTKWLIYFVRLIG
ncbi:MAG: Methyltransferase protein [Candidatus Saccharibacteria bacterium]|nr:Methyltransferase protein [Candidatus Saccharibacteria bacterium]